MRKIKEGRWLVILGIALVAISLVMVGCAQSTPIATQPTPTPTPVSEPIKLKAIAFLPKFVSDVHFAEIFCNRVAERSNGALSIQLLGPEAIAEHQQPEALRSGVVDFMVVTAGMYRDLVPGAMAIKLSKMTIAEERKSGFVDFMDELHRKANMVYLGRISGNAPMSLIVTKNIEKPAELKGLTMASSAAFNNFVLAWGAVPIDTPEHYVALERGVVNGVGGTATLFEGQSLYEVAKYWIDQPYGDSDITLTMNQDRWKSLPEHLQNVIMDVTTELDTEVWDWFGTEVKRCTQVMLDSKAIPIHFSAADAEWYVTTGRNAEWAVIKEKVDPGTYAKLRDFIKE